MLLFSLDRIRNEYVRVTLLETKYRGKLERVWTCEEEGWWIYWVKGIENGAARQATVMEVGGHTEGWCDKQGY